MGFFNNFPYTNFHQLNLDWIMKEMENLKKYVENYTAVNKISYAGVWDITKQYPQWALVTDGETSWLSLKPVPVGIPLENEDYWQKLADLDPRIAGIVAEIAEINKKLPKNSKFLSQFTKVSDYTEILRQMRNTTLIVDFGDYPIEDSVVIDKSNYVVFVGGVFRNAKTVTIPNYEAPPVQIASGPLILGNGGDTGYVEWFGGIGDGISDCTNAFNKAISSLGTIKLLNATYKVTKTISVKTAILIDGSGVWNKEKPYTKIVSTAETAFDIYGDNKAGLENVGFSNLTIEAAGKGSTAFKIVGVNRALFTNLFVYNATRAFDVSRCVGCVWDKCNSYVDFVGEAYCFYLHGVNYPTWFAAGDNASLFIQNCRIISLESNTDNAIGIYGYNENADIYIENFEASNVKHGIILAGTDSRANTNADISISGCVIDRYKESGITVKHMQPTSCIIERNYVAPIDGNTIYNEGIHVDSCFGVSICNNNIWGGYLTTKSDKFRGVHISYCKSIVMTGNIITGFYLPILGMAPIPTTPEA